MRAGPQQGLMDDISTVCAAAQKAAHVAKQGFAVLGKEFAQDVGMEREAPRRTPAGARRPWMPELYIRCAF